MLSGVETTKEKVLRIILAGQPELNDKLDSPGAVQLAQRIRLRFHLHDAVARATRAPTSSTAWRSPAPAIAQIFADDTFPLIFRYTGGVPRLINTLCDTAMMAAFTADRDTVTRDGHRTAPSAELQWVEFARRARQHARRGRPARHRRCRASRDRWPRRRWRASWSATDGRTVQESPLRPGRVIVGRTAGQRPARSTAASSAATTARSSPRRHSCVIEDLNSTNGIFVKSKRVRRTTSNDGDVVLIGKHEMIYIDERAARPRHNLADTMPGLQALREADIAGPRIAGGR